MKTIYQPKGKAHEYCHWACNLYNGCSNKCDYCYNRHCQAKALLGKDEPTLKAGLQDIDHAFNVFMREFDKCKYKIMADGGELFFNFVSDPFLDTTCHLNLMCISYVLFNSQVTVRTLTKCTKPLFELPDCVNTIPAIDKSRWKIGFTLTGCDHLEPGADPNDDRIKAIKTLAENGFSVWASIEPVIHPAQSITVMADAYIAGCREFKIGLLSGKKSYSPQNIRDMKLYIDRNFADCNILWKDSVIDFIK